MDTTVDHFTPLALRVRGNNVVMTTVIEKVEMVEILGKHSVERVRYVINNLLHMVIVKYGVISLVLCISTCLLLVTIVSLLVKYLVIIEKWFPLRCELQLLFRPC